MMMILGAAAAAAAEVEGSHGGVLSDTSFWVLLGFALVIGIFIKVGVPGMLTAQLDKRGQKIADEINEARRLREEAQELLAKYQRRQKEAESEAEAIIEQARKAATQMRNEARDKINEDMARRVTAAKDKIARAEAQAVAEVRDRVAEAAVAAAETIIKERMDSAAQSAFIDRSISELRSRMN